MTAQTLKALVDSSNKFYADDFVYGYRKNENGNIAVFWATHLRHNIYAAEIEHNLENIKHDDVLNSLNLIEEQAFNSYRYLHWHIEYPYHKGPTRNESGYNHYDCLKVKQGDVKDFRGQLLNWWPTVKFFETKEELMADIFK